jgi:hypothetical protein
MLPTDLVIPPFLVAAALLMVGGAVKVIRPAPAIRALDDAWLPSGPGKVRLLAAAEMGVGAGCLIVPGRALAACLAGTYFLFAAFLVRLMRAGPSAESCGCVGSRATPPSIVHVGLDLLAAASGVGSSVVGVPGVMRVAQGGPLLGIPIALGLVACGYAAYSCVVYLPHAWATYRPHSVHDGGSNGRPHAFTLSPGAGP